MEMNKNFESEEEEEEDNNEDDDNNWVLIYEFQTWISYIIFNQR